MSWTAGRAQTTSKAAPATIEWSAARATIGSWVKPAMTGSPAGHDDLAGGSGVAVLGARDGQRDRLRCEPNGRHRGDVAVVDGRDDVTACWSLMRHTEHRGVA